MSHVKISLQYNQALINHGSFTFWIDEETIREWDQVKQSKRCRPRHFSDLAIATARICSMPCRAQQGLIGSLFALVKIPLTRLTIFQGLVFLSCKYGDYPLFKKPKSYLIQSAA
jgi:hypothetical protein